MTAPKDLNGLKNLTESIAIATMEPTREVALPGADSYDMDRTMLIGVAYPGYTTAMLPTTETVLKQVTGLSDPPPWISSEADDSDVPYRRYQALGEAWRFLWRVGSDTARKGKPVKRVMRVDVFRDIEVSRMDLAKPVDKVVVLVGDDPMQSLAVTNYPSSEDAPSRADANTAAHILQDLFEMQCSGSGFKRGAILSKSKFRIVAILSDGRELHLRK